MNCLNRFLICASSAFLLFPAILPAAEANGGIYDVRSYGAKGDGKSLDTDAINQAIEAASQNHGGTVRFGPGNYLSFSIHLKSNVTLFLDQGSTIVAAEPTVDGPGMYDFPEPNEFDPYEDFGHSHWHNSLIWGENLENVSIVGPGTIFGRGLSKGHGHGRRDQLPEERWTNTVIPDAANSPAEGSIKMGAFEYPSAKDTMANGVGNKAIALKNCRNVLFRDFAIYHGGHFGILAIATDNFTVDNLRIDTNRDGIDIDCCLNVHVSNCSVNSPFDDGICLKSCYGLGRKRACENITITNCHVSGYDEGTFLSGKYERKYSDYGANSGPTGRIKFGTESNGGYKNVVVSNCTFDYCRGLALEIVDGGWLEDVSITNLTMRDITNSGIYIRLGERNREPSTPVGIIRRVNISGVVAFNVDPRYSSIIAGTPGHPIEDLSLSNIRIVYRGGRPKEDAAIVPPENETGYPEPSRHGTMPAYGFFIRHVKDLAMHHIEVGYVADDARPAFVLNDVAGVDFDHVKANHASGVPIFILKNVDGFSLRNSSGLSDAHRDHVDSESL